MRRAAQLVALLLAASVLQATPAAAQAVPYPVEFSSRHIRGTLPPGDYLFACGRSNTLEINGRDTSPRANCAEIDWLTFAFDAAPVGNHTIDMTALSSTAIPTLQATRFTGDRLIFLGSDATDNVSVTTAVRLEGRGGGDALFLENGLALGGDGADGLVGTGRGDVRLEGGGGGDGLGFSGTGVALGGDGDDEISVGPGVGTYDGGAGNDTFRVRTTSAGLTFNGGAGFDRVVACCQFREQVKIRPVTVNGLAAAAMSIGAAAATTGLDVELVSVEYPNLNAAGPGVAALDVVMSSSYAVQARVELAKTKVLLRVPGGVWARNDVARTVTSAGLKKFSWVVLQGGAASPSINLKFEAR